MFEMKGKIVYDPNRPTGLSRGEKWWVVIEPFGGTELTRLFRWFVDRELLNPLGFDTIKLAKMHRFEKLAQPAFDAHISIIRGWNDVRHNFEQVKSLWKKYDGQVATFEYDINVRQSGDTTGWDRPEHFWFVNVKCDLIDQIRNEMGLRTGFRHHLTIGRTYDK